MAVLVAFSIVGANLMVLEKDRFDIVLSRARELKALEKDIDKAKERLDEDRQKKVAVGAQIQTLSRLLESVQLAEELELEREDALLNEILKRHDNQYESAEHSGPLRA